MARLESAILAFNRGLISPLALARLDLKRTAWAAEESVNWMPRKLGSMMLRPGLQYKVGTNDNLTTRNIPFVRSASSKAIIELTTNIARVIIDGTPITRGTVTAAVTNGNFDSNLTGWTDNDESGAVSAWVTGGYMGLTGTGTAAAIRDQVVTVNEPNTEHALRIVVARGPVTLRVGTSTSDDSYINETTLYTGIHSLAFTPTGNFNIRFMSRLERQTLVDSCNVEAAGIMTIATPWGASDLDNVRAGPDSQSVDVMFVGCTGYTQRRIERRAARSWSVVQYTADDGPYRNVNVGPTTISASALSGNITLTASAPLFQSTHAPSANNAGALFKITSNGQQVTASITADNTFTNAVRVTGVGTARTLTNEMTGIGGTGSTWTYQRSFDSENGPWFDYSSGTVDQAPTAFNDGLDNQIVWYRWGVKTGDYSSGTIVPTITYGGGSIDGVVRITAFSSSTSVSAEVITALGGTSAVTNWAEGAWSDYRGWPSAGALSESRLWWTGLDKIWGSITDAFASFDDTFEGDAGPISRSIGTGPMETINWIMPLTRLMLGGLLQEFACRSSNFDEPLTPTNFNLKGTSGQGSAPVQGVKNDDNGIFVQRGGTRLYELEFKTDNYSYAANDLCQLVPNIGKPRIVRIAVQRQPDTRIHCVLSNGLVAVLVYDSAEKVSCWINVETTGSVEDVVILPGAAGSNEDEVYYTVKRTINGSTVRYLEQWATEDQCKGGTTIYEGTSTSSITDLPYDDNTIVTARDANGDSLGNYTVTSGAITLIQPTTYAAIVPAYYRLADAFATFENVTATTSITGLTHLAGATVVVYQDGVCPVDADGFPQTYTVSAGGVLTLDTPAVNGVVGLAYEAFWKSAKLGNVLNIHKNVQELGVVLADTHAQGLYYGSSEDELDPMPMEEEGVEVDQDYVHPAYDKEPFEFDGVWDPDSRLCLAGYAPRPVTVMATNAKGEFGV